MKTILSILSKFENLHLWQVVVFILVWALCLWLGWSAGGLFNSTHTIEYVYDSTEIKDTVTIVEYDTIFGIIDSTETPPIAVSQKRMSNNGYARVAYTLPPVNKFEWEIKEPDPTIKYIPKIQTKYIAKRDFKEYGCLAGAGIITGIAITVLSIIYLR